MSKNKSFLKNILTTTSMVAITLGAANNAQAAAPAAIHDVAGNLGGPALAVNLNAVGMYANNQDGLKITTGPVTLTVGDGQNIKGGIDTGNIAGSSIVVDMNDATIGSISDVVHAGGSKMDVSVDQVTLTLSGTGGVGAGLVANAYDGLGAVTATNNVNSVVNITSDTATFTNTFDGNNGATFQVNGLNNVFKGDITQFVKIQVLADNTFKAANISAANITIANGKTMTIDSTNNVMTIKGAVDGAVNDGDGELTFAGGNNVAFSGAIGGTKKLASINTSGATGGAITFADAVSAQAITTGDNATVDFDDNVTSATIVTGTSAVTFQGTTTATISITLGGAVNFKNNVTTADLNLNGQTATFNTNNAMITGNVTTGGQANSVLTINGVDVVLRGSAGAAGGNNVLNAISLVTDNIFTADSTNGDINIYAPIVNNQGAANKGTLAVAGGNNITFQSTVGVGGDNALKIIDLTGAVVVNKTITFENVVAADTITTGASAAVFSNTVTTDAVNGITTGAGMVSFANTVTGLINLGDNNSIVNFNGAGVNQGVAVIKTANPNNGQVWISDNTIFDDGTVIGAGGSALAAVQFKGDKTMTLDGVTIFAPITTNLTQTGTVIVQNNDTTINGDMGANDTLLKLIKIADGNSLDVVGNIWAAAIEFDGNDATLGLGDFATEIHAPLTVGADGNGALIVENNNVTAFAVIGEANNKKLGTIEIQSANSLIAKANIFSNEILLSNAAATLNLNDVAITDVYGTIDGDAAASGIIEVTDVNANGVTFHNKIGDTNAPKVLKIADEQKVTLGAAATFDNTGGAPGDGGILLGNNSVLNVNGKVLAFNNGAAIDGIGANNGIIVFNNQDTTVDIGANNALQTVRFDAWVGGPNNVGNVIKAGTLDLTNGSVVTLDDNSAANVRNITSSVGGGVAVLDANNRDFDNFKGVADSILTAKIAQANSLTATVADYVAIDFTADGTFKTKSAGHIDAITTNGGGVGTFNADLSMGGGAKALAFTAATGANPNNLKALTIKGNGATTNVTFASAINAQTTTFEALKLDASAGNLAINAPTTFGLNDTTVSAGTNTIAVTGAAATLQGNIVIDATFNASGQVVLDLSAIPAAGINDLGVTGLTYNITQAAAPAANSQITIIKGLKNDVAPTINLAGGSAGQAALWTVRDNMNPGVLTYNFTTPGQAQAQAVVPNVTTQNIVATEQVIATAIGHSLVMTNANNEYEGAFEGQAVLDIIPHNFNADLSTEEGVNTLLTKLNINDSNAAEKFLAAVADKLTSTENVFIPQEASAAFGAIAGSQNLIPQKLADAMSAPEDSGITQKVAEEVVKVFASGGSQKIQELVTRTETAVSNSANVTMSAISARANSFAPTVFATNPIPAITATGSDLYAGGEGMSAGSSIHDRFGVWGVVNAGSANQKQRKGNAGFKNLSQGFTLGADTMVNDRATVGISISHSANRIKYKDALLGSKTNTSSWVGSIYAMHQLAGEWFVRGTALLNRTNINSKELRVTTNGYGQAQSKYHVMSYGGEAVVGLSHTFYNGIVATPTVGLRFIHSNKLSYGESGNTAQNLSNVKQNAMNNYSAVAGISVAKTMFEYGITLTPEAHANFQYGINVKSPKGSFVSPFSPNQTTTFVGTKPTKFNSSYGVSLTGSNERIECGVSGDVNIASKYVGYEGSLKLKVKF